MREEIGNESKGLENYFLKAISIIIPMVIVELQFQNGNSTLPLSEE